MSCDPVLVAGVAAAHCASAGWLCLAGVVLRPLQKGQSPPHRRHSHIMSELGGLRRKGTTGLAGGFTQGGGPARWAQRK